MIDWLTQSEAHSFSAVGAPVGPACGSVGELTTVGNDQSVRGETRNSAEYGGWDLGIADGRCQHANVRVYWVEPSWFDPPLP